MDNLEKFIEKGIEHCEEMYNKELEEHKHKLHSIDELRSNYQKMLLAIQGGKR